MPMVRNNYPLQFDREIDEMFMDRLMKYPSEYERIAQSKTFPKGRRYVQAEISGLGQVRIISEGGRVEFDTPVEGHRKSVEAIKYGLGFQVTEEMQDDDFHEKTGQVAGTLADSAKDKINVEYFSLYNDGNDVETAWDGQFIYDTHTTLKSGDTITNIDTTALSETSLQAAFDYYYNLVDEAGRKIQVMPDTLMVPVALRWTANRLRNQMGGITGTGSEPGSGATTSSAELSGNMNTVNPDMGITGGWRIEVCRYLTDNETWFLQSSRDHQNMLLWKKQITLESGDDFHTGAHLYKVTTRFKPAAFDYKGTYGSFV